MNNGRYKCFMKVLLLMTIALFLPWNRAIASFTVDISSQIPENASSGAAAYSEGAFSTMMPAMADLVTALRDELDNSEEKISTYDLSRSQLDAYTSKRIYRQQRQWNSAKMRSNDGSETSMMVVQEQSISAFLRSALGYTPNPLPVGSPAYQEKGKYYYPYADGEPVYTLRLHNIEEAEEFAVVTTELIEWGNAGTYTQGIYVFEIKPDPESGYKFSVRSVRRQPNKAAELFTWAEASSTLDDQYGNNYDANNVLDKNPSTAWVEGVSGLGIGERVRLYAEEPVPVHGIRILSGYDKSPYVFEINAVPVKYTIELSDGTIIEADPEQSDDLIYENTSPVAVDNQTKYYSMPESPSLADYTYCWDFISFGKEIRTEWIRVTIKDAKYGSKYEDTCITEIIPY